MLLRRYTLLLLAIFCAGHSYAQKQTDLVQSRILILLDRSSSMVQSWAGGKEKYKAADELILRLVDSLYRVNPEVEIGLRVFGHQYTVPENNCYDTKLEVPFSKDCRTQMQLRLADIHPLGVTPIGYALQQAARYDITDETRNAYCLVLITDGGESCGGNICEVMDKMLNNKIKFKPYIVSLEDYAPLRTTYACMGNYLQLLRSGEMGPTVATIIDAFRPALKATQADFKEMASNVPSVLKVNTPPVKLPEKEPVKEKIVFTKPNETIAGLINGRLKLLPVGIPAPLQLKLVDVPGFTAVVTDTAPPRPKEKIAKVDLAKLRTFNVIFVIEERVLNIRTNLPILPSPKVDASAVAPPPPVIAAAPNKPKEPKKGEYKVEVEDAPETSLEIYFTNGKGKFYNSTPQVQLLDPGTNQMVKKFYRTLDENGNPDVQTHILPGRYDIAFTESRGTINRNVEILAGKKNKVYMVIKNTSLSFAYAGAPSRPVKEFSAIVTERNRPEGGRVENQKCTDLIQYEPGNYHIVINTFPEDVRNADLDFNETEIQIAQPGFAKFTTTDDVKPHDITLWRRLGDKFERFYQMDLRDPKNQHLQIQPGEYQIHYQKGPGRSAEKIMMFLVRPTLETVIPIK